MMQAITPQGSSAWRLRLAATMSAVAAVMLLLAASFGAAFAQTVPFDIRAVDPAPADSAPLLIGPSGSTSISGRILATDGVPLHGVNVTDGLIRVSTDQQGRFVLVGVPAGGSILVIDGRHASEGLLEPSDFGYYEVHETANAGITRNLPYVNWLTKVDHANDTTIDEPLKHAETITTPDIPGLELRLPAGAILTDPDGHVVRHIGLTKINARRPPFPFPLRVTVPVYFTAQPGATVISSADGTWLGAQIVYPNNNHDSPGARHPFWRYLPDSGGWSTYGVGRVSSDGRQVVPEPGTRLYELSGAMICEQALVPPMDSPSPNCANQTCGDPIDLGSGVFKESWTDITVNDVIPISITRTYQSDDFNSRGFGVGMNLSYDMYAYLPNLLIGNYSTAAIVLPDGTQIPFTAVNGTGSNFRQMELISATPGRFYGARMYWSHGPVDAGSFPVYPSGYSGGEAQDPEGIQVVLKDGTMYVFSDSYGTLKMIADRFGNRVLLTRNCVTNNQQEPCGEITTITSPNGHHLYLTWNAGTFFQGINQLTKVTDDAGRSVVYNYTNPFPSSNTTLYSVQDPDANLSYYYWTPNSQSNAMQLTSMKDANGHVPFTNVYCTASTCSSSQAPDIDGQVLTQTLADTSVFTMTYKGTTETDVSAVLANNAPSNPVKTVATFDSGGKELAYNQAVGSTAEIDTTYCYYGDASNLSTCPANTAIVPDALADVIDGLQRDTHYTYDSNQNMTGVTFLSGTASSVTYNLGYSPSYNLVTSVTDPLSHTMTWTRPEPMETATAFTDANGNQTNYQYDIFGRLTQVTDPSSRIMMIKYDGGDIRQIVQASGDPLQRTTAYYTDVIGRVLQRTDAMGNTSSWGYDPAFGPNQFTDAVNETTTLQFDPVGNVLKVLNANSGALQGITQYAYNPRNKVTKRTDPLGNSDLLSTYSGYNTLIAATDRNSNKFAYKYDALGRIFTASYTQTTAQGTVITLDSFTWDQGNRLNKIVEKVGSTITNTVNRAYDGLDRLTCETNGGGTGIGTKCPTSNMSFNSVGYTYDTASRLATKTVTGQTAIIYAFDPGKRLKSMTQGSAVTSFMYYPDNRIETITYPAGSGGSSVVGTYTWDHAAQLTSIVYSNVTGCSTCDVTYKYDLDGRVVGRGGALFQSVMPPATSAVFNAADRMTSFTSAQGTVTPVWDSNGNLLCNNGTDPSGTLSCSGSTYSWDARNQLTAIFPASSDTAFSYDPSGRRLTKSSASGSGTRYLYDGWNVTQEQSLSGIATANLNMGLGYDARFTRTEINSQGVTTTLTYLVDALGSTMALANNGSAQIFYSYQPSGLSTVQGSDSNVYEFTGREIDTTGLQYNRLRFYNPQWGRFISEDPIGFLGGLNSYAYAHGDPVNFLDPTGLLQITISGGIGPIGGQVTVGINNGQWNVGAWAGAGIGLSTKFDFSSRSCQKAGFSPSIKGSANVNLGSLGGGSVGGTFSPQSTTVSGSYSLGAGLGVAGSISASGPDANGDDSYSGSLGPTLGSGSSAFLGAGGSYVGSLSNCPCSSSY